MVTFFREDHGGAGAPLMTQRTDLKLAVKLIAMSEELVAGYSLEVRMAGGFGLSSAQRVLGRRTALWTRSPGLASAHGRLHRPRS